MERLDGVEPSLVVDVKRVERMDGSVVVPSTVEAVEPGLDIDPTEEGSEVVIAIVDPCSVVISTVVVSAAVSVV